MKDEELLIKKAKNGEAAAFGELYDEYLAKIYRFVFFKVGRKQDAEDVTHQVFMSAWANMKSYDYRGLPFSSWLYRMALNAVIDFYRTRKSNERLETVAEEKFAVEPRLAEQIDRDLELKTVKTALQKLEPDQQSVLIMKFVDDLSNKEIAQALNKSEGAIRVIQHRALKQLKKQINGERDYQSTKEA